MRPVRRPRRRNAEPETAASLISVVMERLGGQQRATEQQVFAVYDQAVGPRLRQQTCADHMHAGTLYVRVASSAMAHQITLLKGEILGRMAPHLPPGKVTDLRTRVGKID